jgi:hypothetical protein
LPSASESSIALGAGVGNVFVGKGAAAGSPVDDARAVPDSGAGVVIGSLWGSTQAATPITPITDATTSTRFSGAPLALCQ